MNLSGEDNLIQGIRRETDKLAIHEECGMKVPKVTWIRSEARRSTLGQGEARVKLGGGLESLYVQVSS